jgi:lipopolysaccharide transport system permease protein
MITVYSPRSAVREPLHLVKSLGHDIWLGRDLAWRLFVRNIRSLYRQTILRLFWIFLPPLANTAIWVFLASQRILDFDQTIEARYPAYVLAGMVLWQAFIEALQAPLNAVSANRAMLGKLRFPREAILMVGVYEVLFNLVVRLAVLVPILLVVGVQWSVATLAAPVAALMLVMVGLGLGLLIMPLGVLYQDVGRTLAILAPIWMIVTQIVWPAPADWQHSPLNWANPASPLLLLGRDLLVLGQSPHWLAAAVYAAVGLVLVAVGLVVYRVSLPVLIERMST